MINFKTREAKYRTYSRKLKRDAYQAQIDKLPNEFRHAFDDYNFRNQDYRLEHEDNNQYYIT